MSLSLDTPLSQGGNYTFHFANSGNGAYAPTNGSVVSALNQSLSDEIAGVSSTNPSFFASGTFDINFTFVGFQGTQVSDLVAAMNLALAGGWGASDLVFSSADGGAVASNVIPNAPPGAAPPSILPAGASTYLVYAAIAAVVVLLAVSFAKGAGEGVGARA